VFVSIGVFLQCYKFVLLTAVYDARLMRLIKPVIHSFICSPMLMLMFQDFITDFKTFLQFCVFFIQLRPSSLLVSATMQYYRRQYGQLCNNCEFVITCTTTVLILTSSTLYSSDVGTA